MAVYQPILGDLAKYYVGRKDQQRATEKREKRESYDLARQESQDAIALKDRTRRQRIQDEQLQRERENYQYQTQTRLPVDMVQQQQQLNMNALNRGDVQGQLDAKYAPQMMQNKMKEQGYDLERAKLNLEKDRKIIAELDKNTQLTDLGRSLGVDETTQNILKMLANNEYNNGSDREQAVQNILNIKGAGQALSGKEQAIYAVFDSVFDAHEKGKMSNQLLQSQIDRNKTGKTVTGKGTDKDFSKAMDQLVTLTKALKEAPEESEEYHTIKGAMDILAKRYPDLKIKKFKTQAERDYDTLIEEDMVREAERKKKQEEELKKAKERQEFNKLKYRKEADDMFEIGQI